MLMRHSPFDRWCLMPGKLLRTIIGGKQISKTQDEPQWIVAQDYSQHLQYLDSKQKVYHIQSLKLRLATEPLTVDVVRMQQGRDLMLVM